MNRIENIAQKLELLTEIIDSSASVMFFDDYLIDNVNVSRSEDGSPVFTFSAGDLEVEQLFSFNKESIAEIYFTSGGQVTVTDGQNRHHLSFLKPADDLVSRANDFISQITNKEKGFNMESPSPH